MISVQDLWELYAAAPDKMERKTGVYGLEFVVYLEPNQEIGNEDLPLHWRYDTTKRTKAILKYLNTNALREGEVTTFRIWLPEFDVNSPVRLNTFFRSNTKINKKNAPELRLFIHKVKLVQADEYDKIKLVREGQIHSSSSLIDQQWVQKLLIAYYSLFFIFLIFGFARNLRIQFALAFILMPFCLTLFLLRFGGSMIQSYEEGLQETLFTQMQTDLNNSYEINEQAIRLFREHLKEHKDSLMKLLKPLATKLHSREINAEEFNEQAGLILKENEKRTGVGFTVHDGDSIYTSFDGDTSIEKASRQLMYRVISLFRQSPKEFHSQYERRKITSEILENLRKNVSTQGFLDTYLNRMDTPCEVAIQRQDVVGLKSKEFWTTLHVPPFEKDMILFGTVKPNAWAELLRRAFLQLRNSSKFYSDFYFSGVHDAPSFPFELNYNDTIEIFSQRARSQSKPLKGVELQSGRIKFFLGYVYPLDNSFCVVAHRDVSQVYQNLAYLKNLLLLFILLFPVLLYQVSSRIGRRITDPMKSFSQSLDLVSQGIDPGKSQVTSKDEIGALGREAQDFISEILEKKAMSQFLSKMLVESIEGERSTSRRQKAVVLFCSFRSDQKPAPYEKLEILFDSFVRTIDEYGGFHDKFTGHATLGFFLEDQEEHIGKAVDCSIKLYHQLQDRLGDQYIAGVGIYYGSLVVGEVGSNKRRDFTGIGASVNRSARIQGLSLAQKAGVACNQEFYDAMQKEQKDRFKHLGKFSLKGIEEEQEIYALKI